MLVLQMRNFDLVMGEKKRWMEPNPSRTVQQSGFSCDFTILKPTGGSSSTSSLFIGKENTAWQTQLTSTHLLPIYSENLKAELGALGFQDIRLYGNLAAEPYAADSSGDLVLIAYKA
jgi:hypothetical protein